MSSDPSILKMAQQLNDWRRQDPDVASMVRVVLNHHEVGTVGALAAENEEALIALWETAEQFMSPELEVSRPDSSR